MDCDSYLHPDAPGCDCHLVSGSLSFKDPLRTHTHSLTDLSPAFFLPSGHFFWLQRKKKAVEVLGNTFLFGARKVLRLSSCLLGPVCAKIFDTGAQDTDKQSSSGLLFPPEPLQSHLPSLPCTLT